MSGTFLHDDAKAASCACLQAQEALIVAGGAIDIDQLAREVGMTPNYLSSIFKKNTGENLSRYLKGFRMERAREMLENTNEKIGVICEKCGFVNVSYFCQSFREYFGISPQKYRDQGEYDDIICR